MQSHCTDIKRKLGGAPCAGTTHPAIYMAGLDMMTRDLPPTLLVGGNNVSVLTSFT